MKTDLKKKTYVRKYWLNEDGFICGIKEIVYNPHNKYPNLDENHIIADVYNTGYKQVLFTGIDYFDDLKSAKADVNYRAKREILNLKTQIPWLTRFIKKNKL